MILLLINLWTSPLKRYFSSKRIIWSYLYFHNFCQNKNYTDVIFLKTHSAYMLFYKRMEPEEENGKDYKFDVSSELLEVQVDFFWHQF